MQKKKKKKKNYKRFFASYIIGAENVGIKCLC